MSHDLQPSRIHVSRRDRPADPRCVIEEEWVVPQGTLELPEFTEADLARARLILDLMRDLGVNAEGVGVALHLIDQVHDMRQALAALIDQMRLSRG